MPTFNPVPFAPPALFCPSFSFHPHHKTSCCLIIHHLCCVRHHDPMYVHTNCMSAALPFPPTFLVRPLTFPPHILFTNATHYFSHLLSLSVAVLANGRPSTQIHSPTYGTALYVVSSSSSSSSYTERVEVSNFIDNLQCLL